MFAGVRRLLAFLLILSSYTFAADRGFDLVFTNYGRIAAIGNLSSAARQQTIDARGRVVAHGFIRRPFQSTVVLHAACG